MHFLNKIILILNFLKVILIFDDFKDWELSVSHSQTQRGDKKKSWHASKSDKLQLV